MSNDWYEKGELPPVGDVVELYFGGLIFDDGFVKNWKTGDQLEVLAHRVGENGVPVAVVWNKRDCFATCLVSKALRPLRTETDKLVEQAMSLFSVTEATTDAKAGIVHAVTVLIEEGYRKNKPMSKCEFVKTALDSFDSNQFKVSQLKLICEALHRMYESGCTYTNQGD